MKKIFKKILLLFSLLTISVFSTNYIVMASEVENDDDRYFEAIEVLREQYSEDEVNSILEQYTKEEIVNMLEDSEKFECTYVGTISAEELEEISSMSSETYVDGVAKYEFSYDGETCAYVYLWAQFGYLDATYVYVDDYSSPDIELLNSSMNTKITDFTVLSSGTTTGITFNFCIKSNWAIVWKKTACNFLCDCYGDMSVSF